MYQATAKSKVLRALKKRNRVTRKTAIENGWCENITATVSRLRDDGYDIQAIKVTPTEEGVKPYTRYKLIKEIGRAHV